MRAHILTIGDELLIGQTVNTNAAWLGEQLSLLGLEVTSSSVIGDKKEDIQRALDRAYQDAEFVVTTGGLGPTHDDITVGTVASYFDVPLREDDEMAERIVQYYKETGRIAPDAALKLAHVPEGFSVLTNENGTAPGLWNEFDDGRIIVVLPGVPGEMKGLFRSNVIPRLQQRSDLTSVAYRTLRTAGIVESTLQQKIGDVLPWEEKGVKLAYLPSPSGVRLRMTAQNESQEDAENLLDEFESFLRERIGKYIYGTGKQKLEEVLGTYLKERDLSIAVAESCTGGEVLNRLTDISGASAYTAGGVIAYSNRVKVNQLGVSVDSLLAEGAVSEEVARQMAQGVRQRLGADIGLSTTGIAGPTGGTDEKPVGTIWIGYADTEGDFAIHLRYTKDRLLNKKLFSTAGLETVRRKLLNLADYNKKEEIAS